MSKAVLYSINPIYCLGVANKKKTVEIRKTIPNIPAPYKGYIYCTKPKRNSDWGLCLDEGTFGLVCKINYETAERHGMTILSGKVIGEFICDAISKFEYENGGFLVRGDIATTQNVQAKACLSDEAFRRYAGEKSVYGIHMSKVVIYDKPKELREFCYYNPAVKMENEYPMPTHEITRPPQSWCYVKPQ